MSIHVKAPPLNSPAFSLEGYCISADQNHQTYVPLQITYLCSFSSKRYAEQRELLSSSRRFEYSETCWFVELPKTNDIMSILEEQTIPQTVCWAFLPIRLHHISFLNTVCIALITPPDRDKNTPGRSRALQQPGLWENNGSALRW